MEKSKSSNHIQIPKSVLERFSSDKKGEWVYCCDYEKKIEGKKIKDCNVKIGYYEEKTENELRNIEAYFGLAKKYIIDLVKGKKKVNLTEIRNKVRNDEQKTIIEDKYIDWIYNFFCVSFLRAPNFVEKLKLLVNRATPLDMQDYIFHFDNNLEWVKNCRHLCVFHNATDIGFMIPQMCWYGVKFDGIDMYFMPITPNIGLALYSSTSENEFSRIYELDNIEEVDIFNRLAIIFEFAENKQAIYAQKESDISRYDFLIKKDFEKDFENEI